MNIKQIGGAWALALSLASLLPACGEDRGSETGASNGDGGTGGDRDGGTDSDQDGGTDGDQDGGETETLAELPATIALTGCEDAGVGPLCTIEQDGELFSANCGGVIHTGTLDVAGAVTLTRPDETSDEGATVSLSCEGSLVQGRIVAECTLSTSALGETPASDQTCMVTSKPGILPGVTCMHTTAAERVFFYSDSTRTSRRRCSALSAVW